jgi:hypothetical protein
MIAPLALVLAWTVWHRLADLVSRPVPAAALPRQALLVCAALIPLAAAPAPSSHLFFALTLLNVALFGLVGAMNPRNGLAGQLALASGLALLAGLPMDWGSWLTPGFSRVRAMELGMGTWVALQALRSRHPAWGMGGALAAALASGLVTGAWQPQLALHVGLTILTLHSLRWEEGVSGENFKGVVGLRIGTAVSWMTHAFVWTCVDVRAASWVVASAAVLVSMIYVLLGVVTGQWGARVVPAGAALSFLAAPAKLSFDWLRTSPSGLVAVLGSFALFGLGTMVALTKHRWHPATASARRHGRL